jgi:hypothetical protein
MVGNLAEILVVGLRVIAVMRHGCRRPMLAQAGD